MSDTLTRITVKRAKIDPQALWQEKPTLDGLEELPVNTIVQTEDGQPLVAYLQSYETGDPLLEEIRAGLLSLKFTPHTRLNGLEVRANARMAAANNAMHGATVDLQHRALVTDSQGSGHITLHVNDTDLGLRRHSVLKARRASQPLEIPAVSISELLAEFPAHGAKLNIEGVEVPLLQEWTPPAHLHQLVLEWSFDVDNRTATLAKALRRLNKRYPHVELHRKIDFALPTFPWFPPQVYVFAHD